MTRVLNRLVYNLNNGFYYQEKKFKVKSYTFSSGLKNVFPLAGMKNSLKNIWYNWRNGFHELENELLLARIRSVFKKWFPFISVTVSPSRKEFSSKIDGFHWRENPSPIGRMKDLLRNKFPLDGIKFMVCTSQKFRFHYSAFW